MTLKHKALGLTFLILVLAVLAAPTSSGVVQTACADGSCTCGCPPNVCWDETLQKFIICDCAPGGSNPPNPTPAPTQVSTSPPGGQPTSPPPGTPPPGGTPGPTQPPSTPMPTPTPPPSGAYVIFHCAPWPECPEGWADVTALLGRDGNWYVVEVDCLEESACVLPTPTPGAEPPGGGGDDFPCDEPPELDGGILRQDCSQWPGWEICAEVTIAPAAVLRNPWPRSLVGMPTQLWFTGAGEPEVFSDERALACPGVDYGATYDASTFDCGGPVGQVTEGAQVNVQIGAAWRRWTRDMPPLFGHVPPDEVVWVVQDREWSGGMRVATGDHLVHTFETSSWGLPADGPTWNPECQEETCDYDERVSDSLAPHGGSSAGDLGAESYHVLIQTWWWPEWTFRYDEYFCAQSDWGACWGPYPPPGYPVGVPSRPCDHDGDGQDDPGYYQEQSCSGWRWRRVTEPMDCPEGRLNPDTGWCRYDLRDLGGDPLAGSTGVIVAGADTSGVRQGSWTDRWPHYIPVPVLEIQPVAPH